MPIDYTGLCYIDKEIQYFFVKIRYHGDNGTLAVKNVFMNRALQMPS